MFTPVRRKSRTRRARDKGKNQTKRTQSQNIDTDNARERSRGRGRGRNRKNWRKSETETRKEELEKKWPSLGDASTPVPTQELIGMWGQKNIAIKTDINPNNTSHAETESASKMTVLTRRTRE